MTTATQSDPDYAAEILRDLQKVEQLAAVEMRLHLDYKERAKFHKEAWEAHQIEICRLIRESKDGPPPLIAHMNGAAKKAETPKPKPAADEAWRSVSLAEALAGVPSSILAKLEEADLKTVGQLQDFINAKGKEGYTDPLTTIAGIGGVKAQQIADAMAEFFKRWRGGKAGAGGAGPDPGPKPDLGTDGAAALPPLESLKVRTPITQLSLPAKVGAKCVKLLLACGLQHIEDLEEKAQASGRTIEEELQEADGISKALAKAIAQAVAEFRGAHPAPASDEPGEKLFDMEVIVAEHHRLRVTRTVEVKKTGLASEAEEETIVGLVPAGHLFGDWRSEEGGVDLSPTREQVERDVSVALGFGVRLAEMDGGIEWMDDGRIVLHFERVDDGIAKCAGCETSIVVDGIHKDRLCSACREKEDAKRAEDNKGRKKKGGAS